MSLRPRQTKAIADVQAAYRAGRKAPVLVAATGFGKTHTAATLIRMAVAKGKRVWFLAHLVEILGATSAKLDSEGIPHGWIASGKAGDRRKAVQVVMIQTLIRRLDRYQPPDLIIIDECHLACAKSYLTVAAWVREAGGWLLGLTATPSRLDGRGMGELFDELIPTCSTQDLIDEGLLAPIRYFHPDAPDLAGVDLESDDQLARVMNKPHITGSALEHYRKHAAGRPAIAFCCDVQHAEDVAEEFRQAGYRAVAISGESDQAERDHALFALQTGQLDVVCNCALWVAGVDAPAVSCIILLRPTQSLTIYLQSVGRGLRMHPGKPDCVILDHAGNYDRHGHPAIAREWTLDARPGAKGKKAPPEVQVKECPACFAWVEQAATHCRCGHYFAPVPRQVAIIDGELREIEGTPEALPAPALRQEQGRSKTLEELIALGRKRGHKRPELWARHVLAAREAKEMRKSHAR